ncbi:lytic transglycosylase domain-containing protein [Pseudohalocynthiibacter aestuariivivens]|jgi:peptidoglycan lytic transglycosylase|uniref:Lytic transglycosylase domain-containing protein n=1 Tax=Pseudohalocynthiibacter aestuariivivens TaxID=1591409 RepID=A0ABV5JJJ3_9RHOB|nr:MULTISPECIES: lytic transglycosylase domain-containing protein [Pseudohalocynthiibacter]MBS9715420.1 lytic transglycosylase domain-containing protein [Pseudohalocynthiibacter aestuariivivens]MCK0102634.1 lytic transglycosylase domain-containing protein [Pseudohalocynthiibacter sp. F2068]
MHQLIVLLLLFCVSVSAVEAQTTEQGQAMASAMKEVRDDNWDEAVKLARPEGQVALDLVEWRRLRAGEGDFTDFQRFLTRRSDWPGLKRLRARGEISITDAIPTADVLAYFEDHPPQTGNGALQRGRAFREIGAQHDANDEAVIAWRSLSIEPSARTVLLQRYGHILGAHHEARLDMLLWRGLVSEAKAMFPLVSPGWRKLAEARLGLRADSNGVDGLIAAVPAALRNDPGLAYERFLWRAKKGRDEAAIEIALARSGSAVSLGEPERWGRYRRQMARQLMRDGQPRLAYRLASAHHLSEGRNYADLEWLSGFIALRKLDEPAQALEHFQNFQAAVFTPISLGRAGYWKGRAEEALGNTEAAQAAYAFGARYQTSFYGLLAAERAGRKMDAGLTGAESFPDWRNADFMQSSVIAAALLLLEAGEPDLAKRFFLHQAESLNRSELGQLADLALSLDAPHIALKIAKQAAQQGYMLPRSYYPLHPLRSEELPVAPELTLSIARRESEFNPVAVSGAGARGIMQLMPRTAQAMTSKLGLGYNGDRLLTDWRYNSQLGSAYLALLIEEFGKSYVLVAAGYNAGPSRPRKWIERFGDPRNESVDAVDWIEHIPFDETRNYVMRVMESLPVYRARLTGQVQELTLSQELRQSP